MFFREGSYNRLRSAARRYAQSARGQKSFVILVMPLEKMVLDCQYPTVFYTIMAYVNSIGLNTLSVILRPTVVKQE